MSSSIKDSLVANKAFGFALQIVRLTKLMPKTYENIVLIKQILRSATSVGANIEEALGSNSKKEFIHSMNVSKKEARETLYWLKLILSCNSERREEIALLMISAEELVNILTKIVKTSNANL